jgi:hypothetical protein
MVKNFLIAAALVVASVAGGGAAEVVVVGGGYVSDNPPLMGGVEVWGLHVSAIDGTDGEEAAVAVLSRDATESLAAADKRIGHDALRLLKALPPQSGASVPLVKVLRQLTERQWSGASPRVIVAFDGDLRIVTIRMVVRCLEGIVGAENVEIRFVRGN